ncbi:hypothetical protein MRB53_037375 [Persea americana]|nr:hypothetical protein MRB53_037375 [Persea americana]
MDADVKRVNDFWFTRPPIQWIIAPPGLDAQMKSGFSDLVAKALEGKLDHWIEAPAFDGDEKAWEVSTQAIARGFDEQLSVIHATAFYMSLMQKESVISLIAARSLFKTLKNRCTNDEEHKWVDMGIMGSGRHMKQLQRFGRYPTRNALLGRETTKAEAEFLEEHEASLKAGTALSKA